MSAYNNEKRNKVNPSTAPRNAHPGMRDATSPYPLWILKSLCVISQLFQQSLFRTSSSCSLERRKGRQEGLSPICRWDVDERTELAGNGPGSQESDPEQSSHFHGTTWHLQDNFITGLCPSLVSGVELDFKGPRMNKSQPDSWSWGLTDENSILDSGSSYWHGSMLKDERGGRPSQSQSKSAHEIFSSSKCFFPDYRRPTDTCSLRSSRPQHCSPQHLPLFQEG